MTPVMPIQNALKEDYSHALVRVKTGQADEGREGTTQTLRGREVGKHGAPINRQQYSQGGVTWATFTLLLPTQQTCSI